MNRCKDVVKEANLLAELIIILHANKLDLADISAITVDKTGYSIPVDKALDAMDGVYNTWYGDVEVNQSLRIMVSNGGYISRWVHDEGMEAFVYNPPLDSGPVKPICKMSESIFIKGKRDV